MNGSCSNLKFEKNMHGLIVFGQLSASSGRSVGIDRCASYGHGML